MSKETMKFQPNENLFHRRPMAVLVVDDEPEVATLIKRHLEAAGNVAFVTDNGFDALDLLVTAEPPIDILITDYKMPRMDGVTLVREVKRAGFNCEVIMVTGFGSMEAFIDAIRAGAADFVLKPIDRDQFIHVFNKAKERKLLSESLEARTQQLVVSEKMAALGQLASGVAHEINNPNTFIRTNLQLMQEYLKRMEPRYADLHDPDNTEFIRKAMFESFPSMIAEALTGTDRIQGIVGGIKHYAHAGTKAFSDSVDIREVIKQAVNLARSKLKKNIAISENYLNIREIKGNFARLEQVFVNLLVNAADAISDERNRQLADGNSSFAGLIDVSATVIEGDELEEGVRTPDNLILTFYDNGGGIPDEKITKVFDPFFTTKAVGVGTGLGLYICYEIITQHGGDITVQSEPGEGTAFIIKLPFGAGDDEGALGAKDDPRR